MAITNSEELRSLFESEQKTAAVTYILLVKQAFGKSVLQENMAYQDMMDGRGFAFIDPHGDLVESLLGKVPKERVEDIIYFNPADMTNPIGLNMFDV